MGKHIDTESTTGYPKHDERDCNYCEDQDAFPGRHAAILEKDTEK